MVSSHDLCTTCIGLGVDAPDAFYPFPALLYLGYDSSATISGRGRRSLMSICCRTVLKLERSRCLD